MIRTTLTPAVGDGGRRAAAFVGPRSRHPALNALPICAISSLVRDLSLVAADGAALEAEIRAGCGYVRASSLRALVVRSGTGEPLRIGDLVVFRPRTIGVIDSIEVLDGREVPLEVGALYVGVVCEPSSGPFVDPGSRVRPALDDGLDLRCVSAAGGIGRATGCSGTFAGGAESDRAGGVDIVGAVIDPATDRPVNTIDALLDPDLARGFVMRTPLVVVGGSGAEEGGRAAAAAALVSALARRHRCSAVKATGAGRLADSIAHLHCGAAFAVNQADVGLPTTYRIDDVLAFGLEQMLLHACFPDTVPPSVRRPEHRNCALPPADVVLVELGGDLGEAGIPVLLDDPALMDSCAAVVLCCEGALSFAEALTQLRRSPIFAERRIPVYAALPPGEAEEVRARLRPLLEGGELAGFVDLREPECVHGPVQGRREDIRHADVAAVDEIVERLAPALCRPSQETRHGR